MSAGPPRWTWRSMSSTACWSWDARATSASPNLDGAGVSAPTPRIRATHLPVRVRRLLVCPCQGPGEPKSFAALDLGKDAVAPELAYVTAKFAALVPFGKVATLLSELLPISGAQNAGTVRN